MLQCPKKAPSSHQVSENKTPGTDLLGWPKFNKVIEEATSVSRPGIMSAGGDQKGSQSFTLSDLHRRPCWSSYTGLQDPVITGATRSSSDPTTTAAWCVTIRTQRVAASRVDKVGPVVEKCEVMDRLVEADVVVD